MSNDLAELATKLRETFAAERAAIAVLDHARLAELADTKRELVGRLSAVSVDHKDPSTRTELMSLRAEAHATAMLASTANAAVRMLLGYENHSVYDRRARPVSQITSRILTRF